MEVCEVGDELYVHPSTWNISGDGGTGMDLEILHRFGGDAVHSGNSGQFGSLVTNL